MYLTFPAAVRGFRTSIAMPSYSSDSFLQSFCFISAYIITEKTKKVFRTVHLSIILFFRGYNICSADILSLLSIFPFFCRYNPCSVDILSLPLIFPFFCRYSNFPKQKRQPLRKAARYILFQCLCQVLYHRHLLTLQRLAATHLFCPAYPSRSFVHLHDCDWQPSRTGLHCMPVPHLLQERPEVFFRALQVHRHNCHYSRSINRSRSGSPWVQYPERYTYDFGYFLPLDAQWNADQAYPYALYSAV